MALLALLDFGSGFDPLLLARRGGRRSDETAKFGVLSLLLRGARLDAPPFLADFDDAQVFATFEVDASGKPGGAAWGEELESGSTGCRTR